MENKQNEDGKSSFPDEHFTEEDIQRAMDVILLLQKWKKELDEKENISDFEYK